MDKIAIFGASGFGREVVDICHELGGRNFCFLDLDPALGEVAGVPVKPDNVETVAGLAADGWRFAIGIGTPAVRRAIALRYPDVEFPALIHPSATFGRDQKPAFLAASGVIVCAGVRVTNNVRVGPQVVLNLNTTVGHDTVIDAYCAAMPGVNISGNVHLQERVYVGTGAAIINGANDRPLTVGAGSTVGAGAVVVRDVEPGVTVVGMPARPLAKPNA